MPHNIYRREDDDLYVDVPVTMAEVRFGRRDRGPDHERQSPHQGSARLTMRASHEASEARACLTSKGAARAILFAKLKVVTPSDLSDRERELYQELGNLRKENPRTHLGCS